MAITSILGVSMIIRYENGSFTYSYLKPTANDTSIYELSSAINSLQSEQFKSVSKLVRSRITAE